MMNDQVICIIFSVLLVPVNFLCAFWLFREALQLTGMTYQEYFKKTSSDGEVLLGSELKNGAKSRLICMSFPSSGNAERESEMPEYVVTVTSSPRTVTVPVWVVIPAVIAFIIVLVRKKRAA